MITAVRSLSLPQRFFVATLLLACAGWAAVSLFVHQGYPDGPTSAGTDQQVASAQRMLQTLPSVADATVDPYDTACRTPQTYCLTSKTLTATQLMPEVLALLKSHGASIDGASCDYYASTNGQCARTLHWYGARLAVRSNPDVVDVAGYVGFGTTMSVGIDRQSMFGRPGTPLPAWTAMNPLPASWALDLPCAKTVGRTCLGYGHSFDPEHLVAGGTDAVTAAATAALQAHGYATGHYCRAASGSAANCWISFLRYRTLGGGAGIAGRVKVTRLSATSTGVVATVNASLE